MRLRQSAVAMALLCALLAAAGCGLGAGDDAGEVTVTITREYGTEEVQEPSSEPISESDSVMRVLDRQAEITTRYGGGFVQSIDGLEAEQGDGRLRDWFFYVNGVEAATGAADYTLSGGENFWWDYREWGGAQRVPAVVGSWPHPFRDGYEGRMRPTELVCVAGFQVCKTVRASLTEAGAELVMAPTRGAIRVLVGVWDELREDPAAAQLEDGPQTSGVFVEVSPRGGSYVFGALDVDGEVASEFGAGAGLVAATRRYESPPVWIVTGTGPEGVSEAAGLLDEGTLRNRYALISEAGELTALPVIP